MSTIENIELDELKTRQQATWASGNYSVIGTTLQIVGESLCEAVGVGAGWRVLDVAAGNGNASLAAARRDADVVATDYVPELLAQAQRRADADGLRLSTRVADAEDLPYEDAAFDCVLSTFGVMFTPNPEQAAGEMLRVCRPGGRIGLANWTPEGFVGRMFKVVGAHVPPPPGVPSPLAWGTDERPEALLGRDATVRFRSATEYIETFSTYYGPLVRAWHALDADGRASLRRQLIALAEECDQGTTGSLAVPSEYLEVVATRR
jgi:ubiquinone/menaquinone biosynthesis C-methylase UbiE